MSTPFIGTIMAFGFNYPPVGWVPCNGSLLQIADYDALFSLIGTTYGGDGITTFGVPDLRGRSPLSMGQGPGLSNYVQGQLSGTESVTLVPSQMPLHTHTLMATNAAATTNNPTGAVLATAEVWTDIAPDSNMLGTAVQNAGGNLPHENRQPSLVVNFCMATDGIFPSQN
jgi:microcystin-dependent protein